MKAVLCAVQGERGGVSRTLSGDDSEARPLLASSEVSANSLHLSPTSPISIPTSISLVSQDYSSNGGGGGGGGIITPLPDTIRASDSTALSGGEPGSSGGLVGPCSPVEGESGSVNAGNFLGQTGDASSQSPDLTTSTSPVPQEAGPGQSSAAEAAGGVSDDTLAGGTDSNGGVPMPLVRFCGLTQSDTSLTSVGGNQHYSYGTQSEYSPPDPGHYSAVDYINGINAPSYHALRFLHNPTLFGSRCFVPQNSLVGDPSPPTPGVVDPVRGQGRYRSVDLTKQDSLMSDYGWYYDPYGNISSPPPISANADCVFADLPGAMTSDSGPPPSNPTDCAVSPRNTNPHSADDPGARLCTAAAESNGQPGCGGGRSGGGGSSETDVCENNNKSKEEKAGPKCIAAVGDGGGSSNGGTTPEQKPDLAATVQDSLPSSSPASQTLPGDEEASGAPTNPRDLCDQSGAQQLPSADRLSNQCNASARSGMVDGEPVEPKDCEGVADPSGQAPPSPCSNNTPETTVVMKRLLSSEEARTTFL
ncbi:hypothetical protein ACOMHN_036867 [Nucella lapillus]